MTLKLSLVILTLNLICCATPNKNIALSGVIGGVVGAVAGHELTRNKEHRDRNTVVTSLAFGLAAAGAMAWHYREMEQQLVEISGRYSRYRLCDVSDSGAPLAPVSESQCTREEVYQIPTSQVSRTAISLDDETKWVFPTFRKRLLGPEKGTDHVISRRYIWEVIRPGTFVTKDQNPELFE